MAVVHFSITQDAVGHVSDALACLAKFGDSVSIEARSDKITFTTLNTSQTAYASFAFDCATFFLEYKFNPIQSSTSGDRFTCQLLNKALHSVFRSRLNDVRGRDSGVERCDVVIHDRSEKTECRFIVKMTSRNGMVRTYSLTYESVNIMHALFDKTTATQGWRIASRILREYVEFFGPRTEQLDLLAQESKAVFTSFTEKIQDGKEVLKQPLETAIAIHVSDFEDFHVQSDMHIIISVKDFRAIVTHAETLRTSISAHFSSPSRPLQFHYQSAGIHCEFTLMTTGSISTSSALSTQGFVTTRSASRQPSAIPEARNDRSASMMPPPMPRAGSKPLSSQSQRPSLREQTRTTLAEPSQPAPDEDPDPESLFLPDYKDADEDQTWEPQTFDGNPEDEMLGWDASLDGPRAGPRPTFQDSGSASRRTDAAPEPTQQSQTGLEPTQRLSQLRGMFD